MRIPESEWRWFGHAGHLIVGNDCRFHLCTQIGDYLISTVGEYLPDSMIREIFAGTRKVALEGMGDARLADYMAKISYEEIGFGRKYETMVFKAGEVCSAPGCSCGLPKTTGHSLDVDGYNTAGAATLGHMKLCRKWADTETADRLAKEDAANSSD